jgi:hypothetical protein
MSRAIPPLPNTPSWHGVWLKHREDLTFTFIKELLDPVPKKYAKKA